MAPDLRTAPRPAPRLLLGVSALLAASASLACSSRGSVETVEPATGASSALSVGVARIAVPPPIELVGSAYEAAGEVKLPDVPPGNYPGLQNVYRLSDSILSGSEPVDEEALAQLAAWGVRTVLSVDGKVPDVEGAEREGLRYVHVPIQYKGIAEDQIAQIAKTFRELEAPFYVHCFHGRHRGPAAAAIGAVAIDGLDREQAIAEMRHWCSTASKYEALYAAVATAEIPSADETAAYEFDFTSAHQLGGIREAMIALTRSWDEVKLIRKNGWSPSADHPDIDPLRSATTVRDHFDACAAMDETATYADDFRAWLTESQEGTNTLVELLTDCRAEGVTEDRTERLEAAYDLVSESCLECHSVYRNR
ncbi:MAG: sulfur transferase domain-containing protein [Planctomycetota bacterium]